MLSQAEASALVDDLLARLLRAGESVPPVFAQISVEEIHTLCALVLPVLESQASLLELTAPLKICGDIHGQFADLLRLLELGGDPAHTSYLFLGDYVDRGSQNLETICLLLAYKVKFPDNFFLLRGNHEIERINLVYGFFDECKRRYDVRLWKRFGQVFNMLPVAALIDDAILCMHGGLSPQLHSLDDIRALRRPLEAADNGLVCDLLWADPDAEVRWWAANDRNVSYVFGAEVVAATMARLGLELICRAHQVVMDGYEFFANRRLVTLFSAPNYCGEFDNDAAVMCVDADLRCSFRRLRAAPPAPSIFPAAAAQRR